MPHASPLGKAGPEATPGLSEVFPPTRAQYVLITGASGGFGLSISIEFALNQLIKAQEEGRGVTLVLGLTSRAIGRLVSTAQSVVEAVFGSKAQATAFGDRLRSQKPQPTKVDGVLSLTGLAKIVHRVRTSSSSSSGGKSPEASPASVKGDALGDDGSRLSPSSPSPSGGGVDEGSLPSSASAEVTVKLEPYDGPASALSFVLVSGDIGMPEIYAEITEKLLLPMSSDNGFVFDRLFFILNHGSLGTHLQTVMGQRPIAPPDAESRLGALESAPLPALSHQFGQYVEVNLTSTMLVASSILKFLALIVFAPGAKVFMVNISSLAALQP